jgi:16S rRNA pseudouridine516 synthase
MRLDKYLSNLNLGTRKNIKEHIKNGAATINKETIKDSSQQMDPTTDHVTFQGKPLFYQEFHYFMLHKPKGMISASWDLSAPCVLDLFQDEPIKKLFTVGRLDKDTEGLLLITNDGIFSHKITSPSHNLFKTYYAKLNGSIDPSSITEFKNGLNIGDKEDTKPAKLIILESTSTYSFVQVSISEGRYHQVKRMFQSIHLQVEYLKRISIGSLQLDSNLPIGEYRMLTKDERNSIFK